MIVLRNKEFSSKAQKVLRSAVDTSIGRNWYKEASKFFKPELVGDRSVSNFKSIGRAVQKTPQVDVKTLHGRINKRGAIRDLQKKGLIDEWTANSSIRAVNRRTNPF
jgi:hypothetical protein